MDKLSPDEFKKQMKKDAWELLQKLLVLFREGKLKLEESEIFALGFVYGAGIDAIEKTDFKKKEGEARG
jgi:hypothetical protein